MFYSQKLNARINRLHERASRVVYIDFDSSFEELLRRDSSFEELLRRDSSVTLHQRNLQRPMTDIFKVKTGIALELMKGVFKFTDVPYTL